MKTRLLIGKVYPKGFQALNALDQTIKDSDIDKWHQELIKIRASHLNGCAFCLDKHTQDALKLGIEPRKIALVNVWKEALSHFTKEEQLILEITEQITNIGKSGLSNKLFEKSITMFGESLTAQIIMAATVINAWNRIGVGLKMEPEFE
ncbi:carboxymuconolactone decarboxylase family protein [Chryseobacterium sp. SIMBA_038]|uniref:carboxymuconolactone decarboxylase family protein n=1 Tax=Chryseobacterium sp. SIMBA_038 TaxID=3085780 RepID=UPI00397D24A4